MNRYEDDLFGRLSKRSYRKAREYIGFTLIVQSCFACFVLLHGPDGFARDLTLIALGMSMMGVVVLAGCVAYHESQLPDPEADDRSGAGSFAWNELYLPLAMWPDWRLLIDEVWRQFSSLIRWVVDRVIPFLRRLGRRD